MRAFFCLSGPYLCNRISRLFVYFGSVFAQLIMLTFLYHICRGRKNSPKCSKFSCFSGESSEDAVAQLQKQDTLKISFETVLQEGTQKRYDDDIETKDKVTLFETKTKTKNNMLTTYESGQGGVGPSENCINGCLPEITNHKPAHSQSFLNNFW